jgi:hypothetical protein
MQHEIYDLLCKCIGKKPENCVLFVCVPLVIKASILDAKQVLCP